jgi:hypothetical protein
MGFVNRRNDYRIPLQMFLNEFVADRPFRSMSVNLSPKGISLNHLIQPVENARKLVNLEFELPGTSEVVWAAGKIRYDARDTYFHGTGVEFTGMARIHQRLLRDYVIEHRTRQLRKLLTLIRRNRMH